MRRARLIWRVASGATHIEELLLPGAEAEQRDALRTFDFRRSIYEALPRGPRPSADDADWIIRRP